MKIGKQHMLRLFAIAVVVLAIGAAGAAFAIAGQGGTPGPNNAGNVQYSQKPGCGPDKTEGVAGNSGKHEGQPPKEPERKDCPNPPGQQH